MDVLRSMFGSVPYDPGQSSLGRGGRGGNPDYETPFNVKPFYKGLTTINTTAYIAAPRSQVWPKVRAMDQWSTFQDIFLLEFVDGNGVVELGQKIRISTTTIPIPFFDEVPLTIEQYDEIVEENRICWTLLGFEVPLVGIQIPSPSWFLRTARCIELFDDPVSHGTILHNWISYAGVGWPLVCGLTGSANQACFNAFNSELTVEFV